MVVIIGLILIGIAFTSTCSAKEGPSEDDEGIIYSPVYASQKVNKPIACRSEFEIEAGPMVDGDEPLE